MQARIVGQRSYLCRIEYREKSAIPRNIRTELKLLTHGKASKLTTVTTVPKHKQYSRFTEKCRLWPNISAKPTGRVDFNVQLDEILAPCG